MLVLSSPLLSRMVALQLNFCSIWQLSAGPTAAAQEEHLQLQQNASAVGQHHTTFVHLHVSIYMWSQHVSSVPSTLLSLGCWPGGWGGVGGGGGGVERGTT